MPHAPVAGLTVDRTEETRALVYLHTTARSSPFRVGQVWCTTQCADPMVVGWVETSGRASLWGTPPAPSTVPGKPARGELWSLAPNDLVPGGYVVTDDPANTGVLVDIYREATRDRHAQVLFSHASGAWIASAASIVNHVESYVSDRDAVRLALIALVRHLMQTGRERGGLGAG